MKTLRTSVKRVVFKISRYFQLKSKLIQGEGLRVDRQPSKDYTRDNTVHQSDKDVRMGANVQEARRKGESYFLTGADAE